MELKKINENGERLVGPEVSDALFNRDYNESLVHQVVVAYMANARSADRKQKTRSEVAKSTRKPWKQKGTGRARAGMASSPLWRGGGRAFPNTPDENFSHKVNRKMYRAGMAAILSELVREDRLSIVDDFVIQAPKTKLMVEKIKGMGLDSTLLITDDLNENLYLSSRNLHNILVLDVFETDPVSLVHYDHVVMTKGALDKLQEVWL